MALDVAAIIRDAQCIDCQIPDGMKVSVLIALVATAAGISTDPKSLMAQAVCIDCNIPPGMQLAVLNGMMSQLVSP